MICISAVQHWPVLGAVKVVPPRQVADGTALRGLHLDIACAPAVIWQLTRSGTAKISPIKVSMFSGNL
jgi:hypothetical protein